MRATTRLDANGDGDLDNETNHGWMETSPDREVLAYTHTAVDSFRDLVLDGDDDLFLPHDGEPPYVIADDQAVARVGIGAQHVHVGMKQAQNLRAAPMAFTDYQLLVVCGTDTPAATLPSPWSGTCWKDVSRGIPQSGHTVRRAP